MAGVHLVVDAANVVGSRPDGWWRDRAGAAARLVDRLAAALRSGALDGPVTVVLEGVARRGVVAGPGPVAGLLVAHADADGDSAIAARVSALVEEAKDTDSEDTEVAVVTADRGLRERVITAGGAVLDPSWLLQRLP